MPKREPVTPKDIKSVTIDISGSPHPHRDYHKIRWPQDYRNARLYGLGRTVYSDDKRYNTQTISVTNNPDVTVVHDLNNAGVRKELENTFLAAMMGAEETFYKTATEKGEVVLKEGKYTSHDAIKILTALQAIDAVDPAYQDSDTPGNIGRFRGDIQKNFVLYALRQLMDEAAAQGKKIADSGSGQEGDIDEGERKFLKERFDLLMRLSVDDIITLDPAALQQRLMTLVEKDASAPPEAANAPKNLPGISAEIIVKSWNYTRGIN